MRLVTAVTMQEEDPAGWQQMWESWISPPPHFCPQLVSFTKLNPTWCSRFGSMVSRQDRTQSVPTFHYCFHICSVLPNPHKRRHKHQLGCAIKEPTNQPMNQLDWLQSEQEPAWRLPLVFADPHPVVTQDQLSLSSSSSSGTQTGEMLEAGGNQITSHCRNLKSGDNQII